MAGVKSTPQDWQSQEMARNCIDDAFFRYMEFEPTSNAAVDAGRLEFLAASMALSHRFDFKLASAWAHLEAASRHAAGHSKAEQHSLIAAAYEQALAVMEGDISEDMYWRAALVSLSALMLSTSLEKDDEAATRKGLEVLDYFIDAGIRNSEEYPKRKGYLNEFSVIWLGLRAFIDHGTDLLITPAPVRMDHDNNKAKGFDVSGAVDATSKLSLFDSMPRHRIQIKSSWLRFEIQDYDEDIVKIAADSHLGDVSGGDPATSIANAILSEDTHRIDLATKNILSELV